MCESTRVEMEMWLLLPLHDKQIVHIYAVVSGVWLQMFSAPLSKLLEMFSEIASSHVTYFGLLVLHVQWACQ